MTHRAEITLSDMLAARDNRVARERELQSRYPAATLIVLTVVMPGNNKQSADSAIIAHAACTELKSAFVDRIVLFEERDLPTGFEAFVVVNIPQRDAKLITCEIENNHPLGRLFDIDVLSESCIPLSRRDVNMQARKCIICDNDARICMRAGTHSYEEILNHIHNIVAAYVAS